MTTTPILETLASELKVKVEHISGAFEMIDAGLSPSFIGSFRRARVGGMLPSVLRRLVARREELNELDRRRGTILRALEREEGVPEKAANGIRSCMDRFELEDRFLPFRRPEPEVQLALDRGLGGLADLLAKPLARSAAKADEGAEGAEAGGGAATADGEATDPPPQAEAEAAPAAGADADPSDGAAADAEPTAASSEGAEASAVESDAAASDADPSAASSAGPASEPAPPVRAEPDTGPRKGVAVQHAELTAELARVCTPYVSPDRDVHNEGEALAGATRILSDRLGRLPRLRQALRRVMRKNGTLSTRAMADAGKAGRFRSLLKLSQPLHQLQGHRLLALRQAQKERVLTTRISIDRKAALALVGKELCPRPNPAFEAVLQEVCARALDYRLLPAIEEQIRLELKERADAEAMRFLERHLRQLLLSPQLARRLPVAGVDVNAKGDWTFAVVDADGKLAHPEQRIETGEKDAAALGEELAAYFAGKGVNDFAVGHGGSSRAAVSRLRAAIAAGGGDAFVYIVTSAGLSSYANSELARRELDGAGVPGRMAVSLARRLQNPIGELVKVDARHLGLGPEQGLVSKANIRRLFRETTESCAAHVGCDVNHAELSFLSQLPGLDRAAAERLLERRATGPIESREALREEGILTEAEWTGTAAFLRVAGSPEPLDRTNLHPEQYPLARRILESVAGGVEEGLGRTGITRGLRREDFEVDEDTWRDLMRELAYPGRDPRQRLHRPILLDPGTDVAALPAGSVVEGIVSNVASFGVFVDIGLEEDAMIHISEVSDRYVRDAREMLSVGQIVRARLLDGTGQRPTLSLKKVPRERPTRGRSAGRGREGARQGGRARGGREERHEKRPNLRAAQTRRDGLGGAAPGGRGGNRGGGRGMGRGGGRGPGRGRGERDERVNLSEVNRAHGGLRNNPFAKFFGSEEAEPEPLGQAEVEASPEQASPPSPAPSGAVEEAAAQESGPEEGVTESPASADQQAEKKPTKKKATKKKAAKKKATKKKATKKKATKKKATKKKAGARGSEEVPVAEPSEVVEAGQADQVPAVEEAESPGCVEQASDPQSAAESASARSGDGDD
ncbi:MAG: Tex-like N-terminal domain-containing protein [Planctomycetota bacterium]|nr:Tex-like N-terminal domain-containing protein [Planctomycetota bacterium]